MSPRSNRMQSESSPRVKRNRRQRALLLGDADSQDDQKPAAKPTVIDLTEAGDDTDHAIALSLQNHATLGAAPTNFQSDQAYALALQQQLEREEKDQHFAQALELQLQQEDSKEHEEQMMNGSVTGRAWKFVECVLNLAKTISSAGDVSPVAVDDMVFTAERMLRQQQEFLDKGLPCQVDLGYHFTMSSNLQRIKTDGLLTKAERDASNVTSNYNGSVYGDGIYTGDNPYTYQRYGDVGLLVARLKGVERDFERRSSNSGHDTTVVFRSTAQEMTVLHKSSQCLPLVQFASSSIGQSGNQFANLSIGLPSGLNYQEVGLLKTYRDKLQELIDEFFNSGKVASSAAAPDPSSNSTSAHGLGPSLAAAAPSAQYPPAHAGLTGRRRRSKRRKMTSSAVAQAAAALQPMQHSAQYPPAASGGYQYQPVVQLTSTMPVAGGYQPGPMFPVRSLNYPAGPAPNSVAVGIPVGPSVASSQVLNQSMTGGYQPFSAAAVSQALNQSMNGGAAYQTFPAAAPPNSLQASASFAGPFPPYSSVAVGIPLTSSQAANQPIPPSFTRRATTSALTTARGRAESLQYDAPETLDASQPNFHDLQQRALSPEDECPICLVSLSNNERAVSLETCGHKFHYKCLEASLAHSSKCPVCRKALGKPQGKMPSGEMSITYSPSITCSGYPPGTIVVAYRISHGTQKTYHENPGYQHGSATRVAYLPDNQEGQNLLKRLKFAFMHGLTLTVGTSLTTGQRNCVTWSSIHHKTSFSGGPHGFPDPSYFYNCNEDLDALGVPAADSL